jgi:hypothetical protein
MLFGNVVLLTRISGEVKKRQANLLLGITPWPAVLAGSLPLHRAVPVGEEEFPVILSNRLEISRVVIEEIGIGLVGRAGSSTEKIKPVMAVDASTGNQTITRFVGR